MDTSGKQTLKSCGNAHAWCTACRPEMRKRMQGPKPPNLSLPPCRNCGTCDACLGLEAPEGMKICRKCGETKPLTAFTLRAPGRYKNQCRRCHNGGAESLPCTNCGRRFTRFDGEKVLCAACRVPPTRPCDFCGTHFSGSVTKRRYCSLECRSSASKRQRGDAYRALRLKALMAYATGPVPACNCCSEATMMFLALDHVNGGGRKQMQELGGGGYWSWLRKNNFPPGFQILCHNCNMGRQLNGGICPHKELALAAAG